MEEYLNKYIGADKIINIAKAERKTFFGNDIYQITFDNSEVVEYNGKFLPSIVTEEKSNPTDLQNNFVNQLTQNIFEYLLDSEIKLVDINSLFSKIDMSISHNIDKVNDYLWGKDLYKRTVRDIQNFLDGQRAEEGKAIDINGAEAGGSEPSDTSEKQA